MLPTSQVSASPARVVTAAPVTAGSPDAAARVTAHRPDLATGSPAFQAAVVLLTGPAVRFNIDLLTRRTGLARGSVAVFARRLIDNGVWTAGAADYPWTGPGDPRFWNDVAVAQGRLCRRRGSDGAVEWAQAGAWHKPYEYVDAGGPELAVAYRAPDRTPPAPEPAASARAEEADRAALVAAPARPRVSTARPRPAAPRAQPARVLVGAGVGAWSAPLFPDACWLG